MVNTRLVLLALRNRALGTEVATTGSSSLSVTATGYARAAGSFVTDGFVVGQEVLAAGFSVANNGYSVVRSVSALALGIEGGRTAQVAAAARTLSAGLPEGRAWSNTQFDPTSGRSYITERFSVDRGRLWTFPADGGQLEEAGEYLITWVGLDGVGMGAIEEAVSALKARFAPGSPLGILADGSALRIPTDPVPTSGEITPMDGGWAFCIVRIPWFARSTNQVAA